MNDFWVLSIPLCIIVTAVIAKLTLKKFKGESNEAEWRYWNGRSTYWQLVGLCSNYSPHVSVKVDNGYRFLNRSLALLMLN